MNLATSESSLGSRRAAVVASAAMVAVAVTATAFGQGAAGTEPAILTLLIGSVIVSELMSAYVLLSEFVRSSLLWPLFVGAAYLLTAVLTLPYILTFPAVFAPNGLFGASTQTALQLWFLWHLTFPTLIVIAIVVGRLPHDVRQQRPSTIAPLVALTVAACLAAGVLAPLLSESVGRYLPELVRGRTFTSTTTTILLPLVVVIDALTLGFLYVRTRNRTSISLWLFVAIVASALDAVMGVLTSRYSYGWYIGKVFLVLSSSVMLVGFIRETGRLRTRLGQANDELKRTRERERHLAQARLQRAAFYDELTGLSNRIHLEERLRTLAAAPPGRNQFTVLFISLDRFKDVNDQLGHAAADTVLSAIAERLTETVRHDDTVARFSGDEFVVVAPLLTTQRDAEMLAEALRQAIQAPLNMSGDTVRITASIGIAMFPDDGASGDAVLDNADAAARHAKRMGGSKTRVYSREFFEEARARRRLQDDLSLALLHDEFVLHYQPILDLRSGEMQKVEALLRWVHPKRGVVAPSTFIPVAEQSGLMELIGYWVVEEAVRQAAAWKALDVPTQIAVNVSARQLDDRGFVSHLGRTVQGAKVSPRLLELEITESAAMSDASLAQEVLEECRALGFHVSLDDFGTYYSSLTYLKRLPIDTVKIDRSFIAGLPFVKSDAAIVSGILSLARALERTVVAEGIENESQRAWLARAQCQSGQGFFLGKPMPATELLAWREARESSPTIISR